MDGLWNRIPISDVTLDGPDRYPDRLVFKRWNITHVCLYSEGEE